MGTDDVKPKQRRRCDFSKQVVKEMEALPASIRHQFLVSIEQLELGLEPVLPISHLSSAGKGIVEMKINGRPAYRLVYTTKYEGKVVILAARSKSCEGQDKTLVEVVRQRLKGYG